MFDGMIVQYCGSMYCNMYCMTMNVHVQLHLVSNVGERRNDFGVVDGDRYCMLVEGR